MPPLKGIKMETIKLGKSSLLSSRLVYGCMRIAGDNSEKDRKKGKAAVRAAIEEGFTHFDHADIYGGGECEILFSEELKEISVNRGDLIRNFCIIEIGSFFEVRHSL